MDEWEVSSKRGGGRTERPLRVVVTEVGVGIGLMMDGSICGGGGGAMGAAGADVGGLTVRGRSYETRGSGLDSEVSHGCSKTSGSVTEGVTGEGVWGGMGTLLLMVSITEVGAKANLDLICQTDRNWRLFYMLQKHRHINNEIGVKHWQWLYLRPMVHWRHGLESGKEIFRREIYQTTCCVIDQPVISIVKHRLENQNDEKWTNQE